MSYLAGGSADPERRARIRATIAMAARMVERADPNTVLIGGARVFRLDANGQPVGGPVTVGPLLFTCTFTDVDPEAIKLLTGES